MPGLQYTIHKAILPPTVGDITHVPGDLAILAISWQYPFGYGGECDNDARGKLGGYRDTAMFAFPPTLHDYESKLTDKADTHVPFSAVESANSKYWLGPSPAGKAFFGSPLGEGRFGTFRFHQAPRTRCTHHQLLPTDICHDPLDGGITEYLLEQISIDTTSALFLNSGRDVAALKVFPVTTLLDPQVSITDTIDPAPTLAQALDQLWGPRRGLTGKYNIRENTLPPKIQGLKRKKLPSGPWRLQDYE